MAIVYNGVAGFISTTTTGDTVVDLEFDVAVGDVLLIAMPGGHGSEAFGPSVSGFTWGNVANYCYLSNVVDTQANEWGYAMGVPASDDTMGTMPMTVVGSPMFMGIDTVTISLEQFNPPVSSPAFVSRILSFSGIPPYFPSNGMPINMVVPVFNTPFDGSSFFSLDPDDAIPLPRLVGPGLAAFGRSIPRQEADDPLNPDGLLFGTFDYTDITTESLFVAAIGWDGTSRPWDYYYTDKNASSFPTPSAAPAELGLSADGGTFNFATPDPGDGTWIDTGTDTLGTILETRFAYMINTAPPPAMVLISGDFDVADGAWGDNYDSENAGTSYPYEAGSWPTFPGLPVGDPNIITAPVWPSLTFLEGIAGGVAEANPGIYASFSGIPNVTGAGGTFNPETDVGITLHRENVPVGGD